MSDVEELTERLGELQGERATLQATRTRDDAERAAKDYADAVRRHHAELGGFILGGAIFGDPLQSVLTAFIVSRPEFEQWLAEQAEAVCHELNDGQKKRALGKLDETIAGVERDLLAARKAAAMAQLEAEFAA